MSKSFLHIIIRFAFVIMFFVAGCSHGGTETYNHTILSATPPLAWTATDNYTRAPILFSTQSPSIPADVKALFKSSVTPEFGNIIGQITFTDGLDAQYLPLKQGTLFQKPIQHMYALFSYDSMTKGVQFTTLWYREDKLVYFETFLWEAGTGGMAYTDWEPYSSEWLPGTYEVQIFVGLQLKTTAKFMVVENIPAEKKSPTTSVCISTQLTPYNTNTPVITNTYLQERITWTSLPTLSSEEYINLVNELIEHNAGCRLPCWWGITPGKTKSIEAKHFLESFAKLEEEPIYKVIYVKYKLPSEIPGGFTMYIDEDIIEMIRISTETTQFGFQLHQLLANYGKPDQVFIWTVSSAPFSPLPFVLILYYQNKQILAVYDLTSKIENGSVVSCPNSYGPWLYLRAPDTSWTEEEIEEIALGAEAPGGELPRLKSVNEATNMDIEEFYSTYLEIGNCLRTPQSLW